jgi:hypothetical protein
MPKKTKSNPVLNSLSTKKNMPYKTVLPKNGKPVKYHKEPESKQTEKKQNQNQNSGIKKDTIKDLHKKATELKERIAKFRNQDWTRGEMDHYNSKIRAMSMELSKIEKEITREEKRVEHIKRGYSDSIIHPNTKPSCVHYNKSSIEYIPCDCDFDGKKFHSSARVEALCKMDLAKIDDENIEIYNFYKKKYHPHPLQNFHGARGDIILEEIRMFEEIMGIATVNPVANHVVELLRKAVIDNDILDKMKYEKYLVDGDWHLPYLYESEYF